VKYGTGVLDRVLFGTGPIDMLCLIVYPFVLGHGTHLFERVELTTHFHLSDIKRLESGTVVLEYTPKK
jgi:dihydrofolate reductase